jgi:DNA polymerase III sliding clamp (beta) subunit (PCNA family)
MTTAIQVQRKDLIAKLSNIKDDNISIADIAISRQRLLEALRLQTEDILTINYGNVSWQDDGSKDSRDLEPTPCIQFSCNHTTMRFLNHPKPTHKNGTFSVPAIPLNFIDHLDTAKVELTGIPLNTLELIKALTFVLPCVATDHTREVLECILFDSGNDVIKLVAADGFRLGVSKVIANGIPTDKVLLQIADIQRLLTFLKAIKPTGKGKSKCYPEVYLAYDYKTVKFSTGQGSIELDKQTYTFPDYPQLIPADGTKIEFIANDMLQAVKALKHIANDGSGIIRLTFKIFDTYGKITLTAKSGYDENESTTECDALVESDCKIAVNANYLLDLLNLCKDTRVTMRLTTPSSPMVFDIDANRQWTIMPMLVQW